MKDIKFTILSRPPEPAKFERDGVVREYYKQWATVEIDGLVNSFEFSNDQPLPPGPATLDPTSLGIANGRLSIARVRLVPSNEPVARGPVNPMPPSASGPAAQAKV